MSVKIKVCGVTTVEDARAVVDAGADALGLNFWPRSVRRCELAVAARIARALEGRARVVAVVVDASAEAIREIRAATGISWVQLHGAEPPELLEELLPDAYKAVHPTRESELAAARAYGGDELLVDARVPGLPGGTGVVCDWPLAAKLARERKVWLAGGLTPDNVGAAVAAVSPYGVDVASGVERSPGVKDLERVRAFVREVHGARPR